MTDRVTFETLVKRFSPPWLRRTEGGRLMGVFGAHIDELLSRTVDAITVRFPGHPNQDPDALPLIARDRRIRRGPGEADDIFASRLRRWWDDHKSRGGPYALLRQLHAYWNEATEGAQIDVVYYTGTRRYIEADGTITRDAITWNGDGTGQWSQIWIFFHLGADPAGLTSGGTTITDANAARLKAVPLDWAAAHLVRIRIVLLFDGAPELWGYPQPVGTWGEAGVWVGTVDNMSIEIDFSE